jgi:hypothetical protein
MIARIYSGLAVEMDLGGANIDKWFILRVRGKQYASSPLGLALRVA